MASMLAVTMACAQTPVAAPAWMDAASWEDIYPLATRNIACANVPVPGNPSANLNPGRAQPGDGMPRVPNSPSAASGTLDLHLDVLQMPSARPTPVVIQLHGGGWIRRDRPSSFRTFSALRRLSKTYAAPWRG
ncbi:MAG TPA: hypothetical protein VG714_01605 [Acidobacteriaceae bacterium]|nr:hypothetical protein [Acidobacteriaceae bacterium]